MLLAAGIHHMDQTDMDVTCHLRAPSNWHLPDPPVSPARDGGWNPTVEPSWFSWDLLQDHHLTLLGLCL